MKESLRLHLVGTSSGCQTEKLPPKKKNVLLLLYADERNNDQEKPSQLFGFKLTTVGETILTVPQSRVGF